MVLFMKVFKRSQKDFIHSKEQICSGFNKENASRGTVLACNKRFVSKSFHDVVNILENYYGVNLQISESFAKNFKDTNST